MTFEDQLAAQRDSTEILAGFADDYPNVVIGGVSQYAVWNDHVFAQRGEPITVARIRSADGPFENRVIGRVGRPGADSGTVLTVNATYLLVSVGAEEVQCRYDPTKTYVPGDVVALDWKGATVTVLFKVTSFTPPVPPPPPTAPPPATSTTGTLKPRATDSATWVPGLGSWNNWAGGMQNVYQGTWAGYTTYGSWFYNGATKQLAGATIKRVQLRLPRRLTVGAYNNTATVHVYVHTSNNRPGGDVTRVLGPYNINVPASYQGGLVTLPNAVGDQLKNGGGISIAGEPYMGFVGKSSDVASGQLFIDWERS